VRRRRPDPKDLPPPELRQFTLEYWQDAAPGWDARVDEAWHYNPHQSDEQRHAARVLLVWKDARSAWREAHGWPTDGLDYLLEERDARLRATFGRNHYRFHEEN